jgi:hypothetical protein
VIKDYAANYNTMTDAQAQEYMQRANAVDQQLLALRMKYVPVFEKVISSKKPRCGTRSTAVSTY